LSESERSLLAMAYNLFMDPKDLLDNADDTPTYLLERKLNKLVRDSHKFRNLSSENKEILMDLIKKYIARIRAGQTISSETIRRDTHQLYEDRIKLKITEEDLDDFREVLGLLKNS
jgi:hypothetical protein